MGCFRLPYQTELKILIAQDHNHGLRIVYSHCQQANTWNNLNNGLDIDADQDNDNIADWVEEIATDDWAWFTRGYTGHEMLPEFGLINMNGRAYDPVLGRMLQVDNYIQNPFSSQSYNRYSYVLNNPLKYTDPDGENPVLLGMAIAAVMYTGQVATSDGGFENWSWQSFGTSVFMGGMGGAYGKFIGGITGEMSRLGALGFGAIVHGGFGALTAPVSGGSAGSAFLASALTSIVASGIGIQTRGWASGAKTAMILGGGLTGGLGSVIGGGDFWDGARNGLIVAGLNHAAHAIQNSMKSAPKYGDVQGLRDFVDENFSEVSDKVKFYMKPKPGWKTDPIEKDFILIEGGVITRRATAFTVKPGLAIYISEKSFESWNRLYLSLGHEILHSFYYQAGLNIGLFQHTAIYKWQYEKALDLNYNKANIYLRNYNLAGDKSFFYPQPYDPSNFGFN